MANATSANKPTSGEGTWWFVRCFASASAGGSMQQIAFRVNGVTTASSLMYVRYRTADGTFGAWEALALQSGLVSTFLTGSTVLTSGIDLNNCGRGAYYSNSQSTTTSLIHCPSGIETAFRLFVFDAGYGSNSYSMQVIIAPGGIYYRTKNANTDFGGLVQSQLNRACVIKLQINFFKIG